MKAPYWIAGYEQFGELHGRKSKVKYECDGITFYLFSEDDIDKAKLNKICRYAKEGELEILEDEELIPHIAARLNSALNLKNLLKNIEKYISVILDAEAVSILFFSGDHLEFFVTEGGASGRIESIPVPMESIAGTIFLNKKTMIFNDLNKEKRHFKGVDKAAKFVTKNIVGSPIFAGDIEIGVIEVLNKEGGFKEKDAKLLELFSNLIGRKIYSSLKLDEMKRLIKDIVTAITTAIDKRDNYTHTHSKNVARISVMIGERLGLSEKELEELEISATLHDVGKIGISDSILLKPGKLTKEEYEIIKSHTIIGADILSNLKHVTKNMILGALEHHERCDGNGYPYGKKNGEISLFGRIIAVADVYDALTGTRVYRKGMEKSTAYEILLRDTKEGKFDRRIVEILGELINEGAV